jgi:hypothetical protein
MRMLLLVVMALGGCSGNASVVHDARPAVDAAPLDPDVLRVAGTYPTAVSLGQSSCTGIEVANNPTTVGHVPGATELTLTHVGNAYTGTVQRDGSFATTPRSVGGPAETHTLTIAGRFSTTGFEATVNADVSRNGNPACSYVVSWVGTKSGAPNIIPE